METKLRRVRIGDLIVVAGIERRITRLDPYRGRLGPEAKDWLIADYAPGPGGITLTDTDVCDTCSYVWIDCKCVRSE